MAVSAFSMPAEAITLRVFWPAPWLLVIIAYVIREAFYASRLCFNASTCIDICRQWQYTCTKKPNKRYTLNFTIFPVKQIIRRDCSRPKMMLVVTLSFTALRNYSASFLPTIICTDYIVCIQNCNLVCLSYGFFALSCTFDKNIELIYNQWRRRGGRGCTGCRCTPQDE